MSTEKRNEKEEKEISTFYGRLSLAFALFATYATYHVFIIDYNPNNLKLAVSILLGLCFVSSVLFFAYRKAKPAKNKTIGIDTDQILKDIKESESLMFV